LIDSYVDRLGVDYVARGRWRSSVRRGGGRLRWATDVSANRRHNVLDAAGEATRRGCYNGDDASDLRLNSVHRMRCTRTLAVAAGKIKYGSARGSLFNRYQGL